MNNHFAADSYNPLKVLIRTIRSAVDGDAEVDLSPVLDMDAFARFNVLESVVNSVHMDDIHNWRLYYDPWRTRWFPLMWDPMGWYLGPKPRVRKKFRPDVITSQLHLALYGSYDFHRAKQKVVDELFSQKIGQVFLEEVDKTISILKSEVDRDPYMVAFERKVNAQEARERLDLLRGAVKPNFRVFNKNSSRSDRSSYIKFSNLRRGH